MTHLLDKVKQLLADSSVDMHLLSIISLLSSSADEDDQTLVKAASELLVLVLTGGMSLHYESVCLCICTPLLSKSVCVCLSASLVQTSAAIL